ncbi:MAG TPA: nuclear transport factor 2 family protein [Ilumatobacteraceae bacterium]|nr:nuclear transport factor 2 family protein [Ilumatobacteraceae bacterium]
MFDSSVAQRQIEIAHGLYAAWSSGDADAPERFFTPDGVLDDVASGKFEGWPAIRAFFARGLSRTANLRLELDEWWVNDSGLAVHYDMSGDVVLPETFGPEYVGRRWSVPCMSYLRFDGDRVCYEADYHDKGARAKSLGIGA